jgi:transaldolase
MKIFIDTANLAQIEEVDSWGILDGVTTNPTLISMEKAEPKALIKRICEIVGGPVSMEAMSTKADDIVKEGRELAKIHPNVVVKVPMTEEGLKATKALAKEGIKINMTLVFSSNQALLAAKAGAAYVSPFVGRLDDVGQDGMDLVSEILDIYDNYDFETEVIVASIRHPIHVAQAARMGADVATIPYEVLKKMFKHPLTDIGIARFQKDWESVAKR